MDSRFIFSEIGFDPSLRQTFQKICEFIQAADECNAKVYKPPRMKQARGAYIAPGENGKKAKQVFVMIEPRENAIALLRRRAYRSGRSKEHWQIIVGRDFEDWEKLTSTLREWYLDPKHARKPKLQIEFGDGHALPGGLPETNHSKF